MKQNLGKEDTPTPPPTPTPTPAPALAPAPRLDTTIIVIPWHGLVLDLLLLTWDKLQDYWHQPVKEVNKNIVWGCDCKFYYWCMYSNTQK